MSTKTLIENSPKQLSPKKFSELGVNIKVNKFVGEKIRLKNILNVEIVVHDFKIEPSKYPEKGSENCLHLQISMGGKKYVAFSIAKVLMETCQQLPKDAFPFTTKIINTNEVYEFS